MSPRHPFGRIGGPASRVGGFTRRVGAVRSLACLAALAPLAAGPALMAAEGDAPSARSSPPRQPAEARRVVVQPFTVTTEEASTQKLGLTVQQGLQSELAASPRLQVTRTDSPDARPDGDYTVSGSVHSVNGQVRIAGQVYDVRAGRTLAPLKATGPANNFFAVQDDFARQAQAALGVPPSPAMAAAGSAASPYAAGAADSGSHWAGYENFYAPAQSAPVMAYPPPQMAPPPPPLYGYSQFGGYGGGYGFGGGGFYDGYGYGSLLPGLAPGQLGSGRIERFGQLGLSNAPPPPTAFNDVRSRAAGSFLPVRTPAAAIPPYAHPVQDYRSPNTRFPSPVGQPQRVAPPNLRPGAAPATPARAR